MRKICKIKFLKTKLSKIKPVSSRKIKGQNKNITKLVRKKKMTAMSEDWQLQSNPFLSVTRVSLMFIENQGAGDRID